MTDVGGGVVIENKLIDAIIGESEVNQGEGMDDHDHGCD